MPCKILKGKNNNERANFKSLKLAGGTAFYLDELMEDMGKDKEARSYLQKAAGSNDADFSKKAKVLLSEMTSSWW